MIDRSNERRTNSINHRPVSIQSCGPVLWDSTVAISVPVLNGPEQEDVSASHTDYSAFVAKQQSYNCTYPYVIKAQIYNGGKAPRTLQITVHLEICNFYRCAVHFEIYVVHST